MTIKFLRDDSERSNFDKLNEIMRTLERPYNNLDVMAAERFMKTVFLVSLQERRIVEKKELAPKMIKMNQSMLTADDIPVPVPRYDDNIPVLEDDVVNAFDKYYPMSILKDEQGVDIVRSNLIHTNGKVTYNLYEPIVDETVFLNTKKEIMGRVKRHPKILNDDKEIYSLIKKNNKKIFNEDLGKKLMYYMKRDFLGFGKVDGFAHDNNINGIYCDGIDKPIRLSYGEGLEVDSNVVFTKKDELNDFLKSLAFRLGKEINEKETMVEGNLSGFNVKLTYGVGEVSSKFILKRIP